MFCTLTTLFYQFFYKIESINSAKNKAGLNYEMVIITLRGIEIIMESLILAQNERWRRVLSMQVERQGGCLHLPQSGGLVSNTWVTYPSDGDSL